ncbi:phosphatidylinositol transfer protein beta isoform [Xyrichtys novacula]|uniref:Phosphatidylinositol transfer protein beta isoform n=1 Tax=Xyrichtys novacula TaxID=13765 RepID=A0AAV1G7R8_XYRNO|nr:phosphatidylinositol transfer protein beta isoform [Xyrichtys novacula]
MVLIKEYRVVLPVSVEEYQVGQLYSVAEASKNETGGGEGIEVLKNEPYEKDGEKGQYTHKIYHLKSKVPGYVKMIAPEGALVFHEKAWNAYPYCRTIVTNEYMKDDFMIKIETWHKPDMGTIENVHDLDEQTWRTVEVVPIDIANSEEVAPGDYKSEEDPALFHSEKTARGPLSPEWKNELKTDCPYMYQSGGVHPQARKAHLYQFPPPALLLDRQMGGFDHGGHQADGRGDPKRARGDASEGRCARYLCNGRVDADRCRSNSRGRLTA